MQTMTYCRYLSASASSFFFLFGSASGISCAAEDKLDLLFIFFKCDKYFPFLQEYAARYVSYYVFVVVIVMNASIFAAR